MPRQPGSGTRAVESDDTKGVPFLAPAASATQAPHLSAALRKAGRPHASQSSRAAASASRDCLRRKGEGSTGRPLVIASRAQAITALGGPLVARGTDDHL